MSDELNPSSRISLSESPSISASRTLDTIHGGDVVINYPNAEAGNIYNLDGKEVKNTTIHSIGTQNGGKVVVDTSTGSGAIQIHHPTGAQVYIASDGTIAIQGHGKGVQIGTSGDIIIKGGKDIVIQGDNIALQASGKLSLKGSEVQIEASSISTKSTNFTKRIDGNYIQTVGKEKATTVVGDKREMVVGRSKTQVYQQYDLDVGNKMFTRAGHDIVTSTTKRMFMVSNESSSWDVAKGALELRAKGNVKLQSHDGNLTLSAKNDSTVNSKGKLTFSSTGDLTFNTKGAGTFKSTGNMTLSAKGTATFAALSTVDVSAGSTLGVSSTGALKISSQNSITTATSGSLQLAQYSAATTTPIPLGGSGSPTTPTTPNDPADPTDPTEPVTEDDITPPQLKDWKQQEETSV